MKNEASWLSLWEKKKDMRVEFTLNYITLAF